MPSVLDIMVWLDGFVDVASASVETALVIVLPPVVMTLSLAEPSVEAVMEAADVRTLLPDLAIVVKVVRAVGTVRTNPFVEIVV